MSNVAKLWRVYSRWMKIHWAILLEYRGDTFFYMLGGFISPIVILAVWMTVSGGGNIGSYGTRDFVLYFLSIMFVSRLTASWDAWEIEVHLREGTLSGFLLRPSSYLHYRVAENLVYKLFYGVLMILAWGIAWPFAEAVHIELEPMHLLTVVVAILLACATRYLLYYNIGLLGFWTTRTSAIVGLVEAVSMFLSGRIAPYALLPDWVRASQSFTPFYWNLGFPVDLMTGKLNGTTVWQGLGIQALWLVLFIAAYQLLWRRGLRKYSAVGG
jgi:ABC-2 type transport system permease protein